MLSASIKGTRRNVERKPFACFRSTRRHGLSLFGWDPRRRGSNKTMKVPSLVQGIEPEIGYRECFLGPRLDDDEEPPTPEERRSFPRRPYWHRVWIVREIAAAKNICIVCGERTIKLRDIDLVLRILTQSELSDLEDSVALIQHVFDLRDHRRNRIPIRLLDALERTRRSTSSEVLDKVDGLLGLAFDDPTFVPEPNYGISKRQLCQAMTENAILSTGTLDYIFLGKRPTIASDVPS